MGNATELATEIKTLLGTSSQRLIELTNPDDNAATTIDDTILEQACELAMGHFLYRSGIDPVTNPVNYAHVAILVDGVMWILENKTGRDVGSTQNFAKDFFAGLESLRKRAYVPLDSKNNKKKSTQADNTLPDMDRDRRAFKNRRSLGSRSLVNEINED